jgi:hypothetical protein
MEAFYRLQMAPINSVQTVAVSKNQKLTVKRISGEVVEQSVNLEQFLNSS